MNRETLSQIHVALSEAKAAREHAHDALRRLAFIRGNQPFLNDDNTWAVETQKATNALVVGLGNLIERFEEQLKCAACGEPLTEANCQPCVIQWCTNVICDKCCPEDNWCPVHTK